MSSSKIVVFFHSATKSLITADLYWNYPSSHIPNKEHGQDDPRELAPVQEDGIPWKSQFWKFVMDRVYYPLYNGLMVTDQNQYKAIGDHIVNVWDPEIVVPCHGDLLRGKDLIRRVLRKHFQVK